MGRKLALSIMIMLCFIAITMLHYSNTARAIKIKGGKEIVLDSPVIIDSGKTVVYENLIIRYESSASPIFTVYGTLKLINCIIVPSNPVDFISINSGTVFIKNVTIHNPSDSGSGYIFNSEGGYLHVNGLEATGFSEIQISNIDNLYFAKLNISVSNTIYISDSKNITLTDSTISLNYQGFQTRLIELSFINGGKVLRNTISIPVQALRDWNAWLEALCINMAENIIVAENNIVNGGKVVVLYSSINVLIVNNTLGAEELVEGSEVQIDWTSANVSIINNTIYNLWEGIEIYTPDNVTARYNTLLNCELGIKVDTEYWEGEDNVIIEGNKFIKSGAFLRMSSGPVLENNYFEDTEIALFNSSNILIRFNVLRNTTIYLMDVANVAIVNNTIYIEEGKDWYQIEGSAENIVIENNTVYTLPGPGEEQPPEEEVPGEEPITPPGGGEGIPIPLEIIMGAGILVVIIITLSLRKRRGE